MILKGILESMGFCVLWHPHHRDHFIDMRHDGKVEVIWFKDILEGLKKEFENE